MRSSAMVGVAIVLLAAWPARAEDVVETCASASERAQALRDDGSLVKARKELIACAAERCPTVVQRDCVAWLSEVDRSMPTVIVIVKDAEGDDVSVQGIEIDGVWEKAAGGGRAFAVDPGAHTFVYASAGGSPVTQRVVVREGERGRRVVLEVPASSHGGDDFSVPVGGWVLAGVGVAAIGVFVGLAAYADGEVDDMRSSCAPFCSQERVDESRRLLIGANVSLGVGLAAVGAAVVWTLIAGLSDDADDVAMIPGFRF